MKWLASHGGSSLFGDLYSIVQLGFNQQHGKFFAAKPGKDLVRTTQRLITTGEFLQNLVASQMAVGVIEFFEEVNIHDHKRKRTTERFGSFQFPRQRIDEVPFVVNVGQSVFGHHRIHRFVVLGFDRITGQKLENMIADLDLIAVVQTPLFDLFAVEECAVGTAQILDQEPLLIFENAGMLPRDGGIITKQIIAWFATKRGFALRQPDHFVVQVQRMDFDQTTMLGNAAGSWMLGIGLDRCVPVFHNGFGG